MKVIVTGSHGLIGSALVERLTGAGHTVTRLVRSPQPGAGEVAWDPEAGTIDQGPLEGHDAAVHLAGAGIADHRWTDRHKTAVLQSRVKGTSLLARTLAALDPQPRVLASGSAVGFYGDRGDAELTEASPSGGGFLADVVRQWEAATAPAEAAGIRVAHLRSGIVLSPKGGALKKQLPLFRFGVGGRLGSGRQWTSWISLDDEVSAIVHVLTADSIAGPVNLTAPHPVTNADFTKTLAQVLHRPSFMAVPGFALKAVLGREMAEEMLLGGQRVLPEVLEGSGFTFATPDLGDALRSMI
jgi:uncharacterized protein (TIGR01777 family)